MDLENPAGAGILAIWNDCGSGKEAAYEAWYQGEHLRERLGVPGFRIGRRLRRIAGDGPEYFTYYEVDTPDVLSSPAYQKVLENPSPVTSAIMVDTLINMCRTVCRVTASYGPFRGGFAATLSVADGVDLPTDLLAELAADPAVARAEAWTASEPPGGGGTKEEAIRGQDRKIAGALMVETLSEAAAHDAAQRLSAAVGVDAEVGVYRLMCELTA